MSERQSRAVLWPMLRGVSGLVYPPARVVLRFSAAFAAPNEPLEPLRSLEMTAAAQALWCGTILDASLKAGSTRSMPTLKLA